jgi:hypothetical protein
MMNAVVCRRWGFSNEGIKRQARAFASDFHSRAGWLSGWYSDRTYRHIDTQTIAITAHHVAPSSSDGNGNCHATMRRDFRYSLHFSVFRYSQSCRLRCWYFGLSRTCERLGLREKTVSFQPALRLALHHYRYDRCLFVVLSFYRPSDRSSIDFARSETTDS